MRIKKRTKRKIKKLCEGSVSLLLCILMTPFLMLASALLEFSRYQESAELLQELMDLSSLSVLANYDSYLEERFGLFGVSQDCDISKVYKEALMKNTNLMGKAATVFENGTYAEGAVALNDLDALKLQLLDFCEGSVAAEILLEDLNLEDLIKFFEKKLCKNLNKIEAITNSSQAAANNIESIVTDGEDLQLAVVELQESVKKFHEENDKLFERIKEFLKKLSGDGIDPVTSDDLKDGYLSDVKDIYTMMHNVIDASNDILIKMNNVRTAVDKIRQDTEELASNTADTAISIRDLSDSIEEEKEKDDSEKKQSVENTANTYEKASEDISKKIDKAFEEDNYLAWVELGKEEIDKKRDEFNDLVKTMQTVWGKAFDKGVSNLNKYFEPDENGNLSSDAQEDLKSLAGILNSLMPYYNSNDEANLKAEFDKNFVDGFFNNDFSSLKGIVETMNAELDQTLTKSVEEFAVTKILEVVDKIFGSGLLFNYSMNAYLVEEAEVNDEKVNPYKKLLEAFENLVEAGQALVSGNLKEMLKGIGKIFSAAASLIEALVNLVQDFGDKIDDAVKLFNDGNFFENIYARLLLCGYVTHNLPNRTTYDPGNIDHPLKGKALTGYDFSKIRRPDAGEGSTESGGFSVLKNYLSNMIPSYNSDYMLKGAELEYVNVGTRSEILNQIVSFMSLYVLRLMIDLIPVLTSSEVEEMSSAAGPFAPVILIIIALAEPLLDAFFLVNPNFDEMPLIKTKIFLTPSGLEPLIANLANISDISFVKTALGELKSESGNFGMDYETHMLLILLFTVNEEDLLLRLSNVINFETAYHYKLENEPDKFKNFLSNSYESIDTYTTVRMNSFVYIFQSSEESAAVKSIFTQRKGY